MEFSIEKKELAGAIALVEKAVPRKTTLSILETIKVEATGTELVFTANDMELGIETRIPNISMAPGEVCLEAKLLSDIIKKMPDKEITVSATDTEAVISAGKTKFKMPCRKTTDFVDLPVVDEECELSISQFTLKELVRQTAFATAEENTSNKAMSGLSFEVKEEKLRVAALDGHRIAIRNVKLSASYPEKKVIIPKKTMLEMARILPGAADSTAKIGISEKHVTCRFENTKLVSRLIDGEYFKVDQMLTSAYQTKLSLDREDLTSALDRASLLATDEGSKKPFVMDIKNGETEVSIVGRMGNMRESLENEKEGEDLRIGFNPAFFLDALKAVDEEKVSLYMTSPKAPCYLKDNEGTYTYVILPVNIAA